MSRMVRVTAGSSDRLISVSLALASSIAATAASAATAADSGVTMVAAAADWCWRASFFPVYFSFWDVFFMLAFSARAHLAEGGEDKNARARSNLIN